MEMITVKCTEDEGLKTLLRHNNVKYFEIEGTDLIELNYGIYSLYILSAISVANSITFTNRSKTIKLRIATANFTDANTIFKSISNQLNDILTLIDNHFYIEDKIKLEINEEEIANLAKSDSYSSIKKILSCIEMYSYYYFNRHIVQSIVDVVDEESLDVLDMNTKPKDSYSVKLGNIIRLFLSRTAFEIEIGRLLFDNKITGKIAQYDCIETLRYKDTRILLSRLHKNCKKAENIKYDMCLKIDNGIYQYDLERILALKFDCKSHFEEYLFATVPADLIGHYYTHLIHNILHLDNGTALNINSKHFDSLKSIKHPIRVFYNIYPWNEEHLVCRLQGTGYNAKDVNRCIEYIIYMLNIKLRLDIIILSKPKILFRVSCRENEYNSNINDNRCEELDERDILENIECKEIPSLLNWLAVSNCCDIDDSFMVSSTNTNNRDYTSLASCSGVRDRLSQLIHCYVEDNYCELVFDNLGIDYRVEDAQLSKSINGEYKHFTLNLPLSDVKLSFKVVRTYNEEEKTNHSYIYYDFENETKYSTENEDNELNNIPTKYFINLVWWAYRWCKSIQSNIEDRVAKLVHIECPINDSEYIDIAEDIRKRISFREQQLVCQTYFTNLGFNASILPYKTKPYVLLDLSFFKLIGWYDELSSSVTIIESVNQYGEDKVLDKFNLSDSNNLLTFNNLVVWIFKARKQVQNAISLIFPLPNANTNRDMTNISGISRDGLEFNLIVNKPPVDKSNLGTYCMVNFANSISLALEVMSKEYSPIKLSFKTNFNELSNIHNDFIIHISFR